MVERKEPSLSSKQLEQAANEWLTSHGADGLVRETKRVARRGRYATPSDQPNTGRRIEPIIVSSPEDEDPEIHELPESR